MDSSANHLTAPAPGQDEEVQSDDPDAAFFSQCPDMFVEYEDAEYEFEGEMHPYKTWPEVGTRFDSPGSVACAKFLATDGVAMVRGKRMLEVGSGNGLISLIAARAGAMEVIATDADHDEEKLGSFLEGVMASGAVVDGTIAQDESQAAAIWRVREGITSALAREGWDAPTP